MKKEDAIVLGLVALGLVSKKQVSQPTTTPTPQPQPQPPQPLPTPTTTITPQPTAPAPAPQPKYPEPGSSQVIKTEESDWEYDLTTKLYCRTITQYIKQYGCIDQSKCLTENVNGQTWFYEIKTNTTKQCTNVSPEITSPEISTTPTPAPTPIPTPIPQPQPMPTPEITIAIFTYDPQRIFYYQGIKNKVWDITPTPTWVSINAFTVPRGTQVTMKANPITTETGNVYTCKQIQVFDAIGNLVASGTDTVTFTAVTEMYSVYARFY